MELSALFSDGAVLQREVLIPVWGWTKPGELVRASLAGNEAWTRAADTGKFMLFLPPLPAGGPYELTVASGEASVTVRDVLVGDVWLASGQSNMQYTLGTNWASQAHREGIVNKQQADEYLKLNAGSSRFRFITVPKEAPGTRQEHFDGCWRRMDSKDALEASAVAAWFGYFIQQKVDVPVGVIVSAWGGTFAAAWTSREALLRNSYSRENALRVNAKLCRDFIWDKSKAGSGEVMDEPETRSQEDPGNLAEARGWGRADFDDSDWRTMYVPGSWIRQKIAGNGVVWLRQEVTLPENWQGQELQLELGPIDKMDVTYFNGQEIGRSGEGLDERFWDTPRKYVVPAALVHAGRNVIAIRAFSYNYDGALSGVLSTYRLWNESRKEGLPLKRFWKARAEYDFGVIPRPLVCGPEQPNTHGILFDSMINPLIPYGIKGVLWYQGEQDTPDPDAYALRLTTLFEDWRYRWGNPHLPIFIVQLAGYREQMTFEPDSAFAVLREQQARFCDETRGAYLSTAVDIGDELDIHPQNKRDVGFRLAMNALNHVYGFKEQVPCGPVLQECRLEGAGRVRVTFSMADGLKALPDVCESFVLMDEEENICPVRSVDVEGASVVMSFDESFSPTDVFYAWAGNPRCSLYNGASFPAFPFHMALQNTK